MLALLCVSLQLAAAEPTPNPVLTAAEKKQLTACEGGDDKACTDVSRCGAGNGPRTLEPLLVGAAFDKPLSGKPWERGSGKAYSLTERARLKDGGVPIEVVQGGCDHLMQQFVFLVPAQPPGRDERDYLALAASLLTKAGVGDAKDLAAAITKGAAAFKSRDETAGKTMNEAPYSCGDDKDGFTCAFVVQSGFSHASISVVTVKGGVQIEVLETLAL